MGANSDLALLDDDTIKAAYMKALEPFEFEAWIECKPACDIYDEENPRKLQTFWDPVGAIEHATNMRDERHETWVKIIKKEPDATGGPERESGGKESSD